jgi:acetyl esterase/lipase
MTTTASPTQAPSYTGSAEPPFVLPETVELRPNVVYASAVGQDWLLDLFLPRPRAAVPTPSPAIVYVHGGGWRGGTRQQFWRHAAHMANLGYAGACVQYPLVPHTYPHQLALPQAAVRWLRGQAQTLSVDPARLAAVGGSAGGHLVALLGSLDAPEDGLSSRVQAVVAFNGVFDLGAMLTERAETAVVGLLGGDTSLARDASPHWRATADTAPTLLLHGDADTTVPYAQATAYQRRLQELGVRCDLYTEPGAAHGFFNRSPYYERTVPVMERFLVEILS